MKWFLLLCLIFQIAAHPLNLRANEFWSCEGCEVEGSQHRINGMIRAAIYREPRYAYLGLDMGWLDDVVNTETAVVVNLIKPSRLKSVVMPDVSPLPKRKNDEVFHIVVSEMQDSEASERIRPSDVDTFLTHNPCWIPLHGMFIHPIPYYCDSYSSTSSLLHLFQSLLYHPLLNTTHNTHPEVKQALVVVVEEEDHWTKLLSSRDSLYSDIMPRVDCTQRSHTFSSRGSATTRKIK